MRIARSKGHRTKGTEHKRKFKARICAYYALCFIFYVFLSFLVLFFYGCSSIKPPDDYYQQVLEMENYGKQARVDKDRNAGEVVAEPSKGSEVNSSSEQMVKQDPTELITEEPAIEPEKVEESTQQAVQGSADTLVEKKEDVNKAPERPPERKAITEASTETSDAKPIAVASDVIKIALNSANLGISVRSLELINGRLSGGKNSIRVYFLSESLGAIDNKFVAICAVIYHLDSETKTIDVIIGMAEDKQANLLAVLQSEMSDVAAWMNNELSPAEWRSRIIKKVL